MINPCSREPATNQRWKRQRRRILLGWFIYKQPLDTCVSRWQADPPARLQPGCHCALSCCWRHSHARHLSARQLTPASSSLRTQYTLATLGDKPGCLTHHPEMLQFHLTVRQWNNEAKVIDSVSDSHSGWGGEGKGGDSTQERLGGAGELWRSSNVCIVHQHSSCHPQMPLFVVK